MVTLPIEERWEYDLAVKQGFEPLIDGRFDIDIKLRIEIQRELFGEGHTPQENERFYRWVWQHKPHLCEETLQPLRRYSAIHISHILSRGAYPEMAHDPRNTNMLILDMHNKWENGNRQEMRIYTKNQLTIEKLKKEYEKVI